MRHKVLTQSPERVLVAGYLLASLLGFGLLVLPWSQSAEVSWLDAFFTAVSAVSTTGLVTVPVAESFSWLGEAVTLVLFQVGGLGYMSVGSFILLQRGSRPTEEEEELAATDLVMPAGFDLKSFAGSVVGFTIVAEVAGTLALWAGFARAGVDGALWMAVYHAVSAFCTAGFSLFADNLHGFRQDAFITSVVIVLSLLGAVGFLVVADVVTRLRGETDELPFTSRLVLSTLALLIPAATLMVLVFGVPTEGAGFGQHVLDSAFQALTALTTVGFSTLPVESLTPAILTFLMLIMVMGAAPGGTGGGVKLTTVVTLLAVIRARLRRQVRIELLGRRVSSERVTMAAAILFSHILFLGAVTFILMMTEDHSFQAVAFEVTSAMGTVGLTTGITSELSPWGRGIVMVTMLVGRLRTLTFGLALLEPQGGNGDDEEAVEEEEERAREEEARAGEEDGDGQDGPEDRSEREAGEDSAGGEDRDGEDDEEDADEDDLAL